MDSSTSQLPALQVRTNGFGRIRNIGEIGFAPLIQRRVGTQMIMASTSANLEKSLVAPKCLDCTNC